MLARVVGADSSATLAGLANYADELREFMRSQPFSLPANVSFLGKATATVGGICMMLDPDIDFVEHLRPIAEDILDKDLTGAGVEFALRQAGGFAKEAAAALRAAPSLVERMSAGKLTVRVDRDQLARAVDVQAQGALRVVRTLIGSTLFIAGVLLLGQSQAPALPAGALMALGAVVMAAQARPIEQTDRKRFRHPGL